VSRQLELGMQALSQYDKPKMLDKAATHFNAVLQRDPDNARAVAGLSIVYGHHFRSSNRDEVWREKALASAQQAISLNPDIGVVQTAYALALDPQQNFETAMKAVRRAKELEPNSLLVWQSELRILLYARQFADVILIADQALELFPNDWLILNLKGIVYLNQAKYQMAENIFRSSVQHHPEVTLSYSSLSMALESQGRIEESLQVLQQGLQIRPDVNLYKRIGQIKFSQGDYQAAVDILRSATLSSPGQFEVWHSFADALMQIPGKENEALSAYRKTQELLEIVHKRRPNDGWFVATLALVEARLKNLSYARKLIRRSLELTPNNPNVYVLAASVYELNGQRAEALAALQTARELGFSEAQLQADPVFKELRKDPAY
jgi:tetratricopeptide (TPR) repeat protein